MMRLKSEKKNQKQSYLIRLCLLIFVILPASFCPVSGQIYSPPKPHAMWDTWLYQKDNDYHLFFLQSQGEIFWNTIGRAVSNDLLHWQILPSIPSKGEPGSWDENPTLTGITVKSDSGYILFYGSKDESQKIGTMFSDDLQNWEKNEGNPLLEPRLPYYSGDDWRDMFLHYDYTEQQWHGFVCAQTPQILANGGTKNIASIAHLTTNNFVEWQYLPPIFKNSIFSNMEVPEYFELNGFHYLLFSNAGTVQNTSGRQKARGTYYVVSEKFEGPYRLLSAPLLLGSGMGRFDVYVGRTILYQNERLLYHHTVGGVVSWGIPKVIRQNNDGSLWLEYWPGIENLKTRILPEDFSKRILNNITGKGIWRKQDDKIFGETVSDQNCILWLPVEAKDAMIICKLKIDKAQKTGLVWNWNNQNGQGLLIDKTSVSLCNFSSWGNILSSDLIDQFRNYYLRPEFQHLRIIIRGQRVEVYVNNRWIFGTLMNPGQEGKIGLYLESGTAVFKEVCVTEIEPMESSIVKNIKVEPLEKWHIPKTNMAVLTDPAIQRNLDGYVSLSNSNPDNKIYYSIVGSESNTTEIYREPFLYPGKGTITSWSGNEDSSVSTSFDQLNAVRPDIFPLQAFFSENVQVRLSSPLEGSQIHYTLDGSKPTKRSSLYRNPIDIEKEMILRTFSVKDGFISSNESVSEYRPVNFSSGLRYYFYKGSWNKTPDYFYLTAADSGYVSQIRLDKIKLTRQESYALLFHGFMKIERKGLYTFFAASNDGSQVSVDGNKIVDNDGAHGLEEKSGQLYLNKGIHFIEVRYFQMGGGQELKVSYKGPGINKQEVPATAFTSQEN